MLFFILRSCSASMIYTYLLIYSLSWDASIKSKSARRIKRKIKFCTIKAVIERIKSQTKIRKKWKLTLVIENKSKLNYRHITIWLTLLFRLLRLDLSFSLGNIQIGKFAASTVSRITEAFGDVAFAFRSVPCFNKFWKFWKRS